MKVDAAVGADMAKVGGQAKRLERLGYDGLKLAELNHDPFMPLAIAAEHTESIELVTSVAVAFSRNPMSMANLAHDLNAFSGGRLVLGLGSQVKPHIERRFSMPWHKAARQMREFIEAPRIRRRVLHPYAHARDVYPHEYRSGPAEDLAVGHRSADDQGCGGDRGRNDHAPVLIREVHA
jgi:alkanesulfonate monooxygenase SsuD/methylene tetrahydromethanopterin reductase-like flavin-dependent oxidoreductase (luciferase family)